MPLRSGEKKKKFKYAEYNFAIKLTEKWEGEQNTTPDVQPSGFAPAITFLSMAKGGKDRWGHDPCVSSEWFQTFKFL